MDKITIWMRAANRPYFAQTIKSFAASDIRDNCRLVVFETGSKSTDYLSVLYQTGLDWIIIPSNRPLSARENFQRLLRYASGAGIIACDDVIVRPNIIATLRRFISAQIDMIAMFYPYPVTGNRVQLVNIDLDKFYAAIFHWFSARAIQALQAETVNTNDDLFIKRVFKQHRLVAKAIRPDFAEHIGTHSSTGAAPFKSFGGNFYWKLEGDRIVRR